MWPDRLPAEPLNTLNSVVAARLTSQRTGAVTSAVRLKIHDFWEVMWKVPSLRRAVLFCCGLLDCVDEGNRTLRNVSNCSPTDTAQHVGRHQSARLYIVTKQAQLQSRGHFFNGQKTGVVPVGYRLASSAPQWTMKIATENLRVLTAYATTPQCHWTRDC